jgi:type IV secretory pathway VirB4 component
MEQSGSPGCSIGRTFTYQFNFQTVVKPLSITKKTYRNPTYLAKEYKYMIKSGEVKNQADLARKKGISRARVTQIMNLLKNDEDVLDKLEQIGDPLDKKIISERQLRKMINKN